ncbi:MAG TPA: glycine cleavage T C-terminal barrel domain-containing protein [Tepidisphaeraceae bacterium]|jgi:folate-binding protein YgfZ|nr:glycine cleavage T C-terminal barrel domain-containing protein [Tepidisphaeraceae bacterium]
MPNPLHASHEKAGAEFQAYGQTPIVLTFGEPQAEYAAIRKSAAIIDLPYRGILELSGKDRHAFVNNLLTNQVWDKETKKGLSAGQGVYGFFLNTKGRIISDMNVLELGERFLLEMDEERIETVRTAFDKYLFAEQVKMKSLVGAVHELMITGPRAAEILQVADLNQMGSISRELLGQQVTIFRDDICGVPGYILMIPTAAAEQFWNHFAQSQQGDFEDDMRFRGLARPAGWAAFNTTRIEAGRGLFGIDFDESILPAETGQFDRAVSLTKGCYLGQEIVARMHARGQVAKKLVGIRMESDTLPIAGAKIYDEQQNEIGGITSSTISPVLSNIAICLGYAKKSFFATGTKLRIPAEGSMRIGHVVELPFLGHS